ncbi:MAG: SMI1/KNR4 family protein [Gemmataceae bacterium]|nr:SMI1/KNR4 family protein [Gemmataceae bacterium]MDW8264972.1 SMI1/KNR4 family protein [Gemmataceae bacterium]
MSLGVQRREGFGVWESVRAWWQAAGVTPRPGAAAADLDAFERRHGVRLPPEVRAFYAEADGMPSGAWHEELLSFWPLAEVGPVPLLLAGCRGVPDYGGIEASSPDAASYFVFADHSIWLHVYAVRLSPDPSVARPVVWIAGGDRWEVLAGSFGEFLWRYAEEPQQVLFP